MIVMIFIRTDIALLVKPLQYVVAKVILSMCPMGRGIADGQVYEDTVARGKPIVFLYGSRPYTGGMCPGLEQALSTMRAGEMRLRKICFSYLKKTLQAHVHVAWQYVETGRVLEGFIAALIQYDPPEDQY
jgi:hypothetical protein